LFNSPPLLNVANMPIYNSRYTGYQKYRNGWISRKQSIFEKNVSNKTCRVWKDLFTNCIRLILSGVVKVTVNFFNKTPYFSLHILVTYIEDSKHYNKIFFHYFLVIRLKSIAGISQGVSRGSCLVGFTLFVVCVCVCARACARACMVYLIKYSNWHSFVAWQCPR